MYRSERLGSPQAIPDYMKTLIWQVRASQINMDQTFVPLYEVGQFEKHSSTLFFEFIPISPILFFFQIHFRKDCVVGQGQILHFPIAL